MKRKLALLLSLIIALSSVHTLPMQVQAKMRISKKQLTMYVGQSKTIKVIGTKKKVKWTSSKKAVATVKAGKIKAKKIGKATIKAKTTGKTLTCKVTVKRRKTAEYSDIPVASPANNAGNTNITVATPANIPTAVPANIPTTSKKPDTAQMPTQVPAQTPIAIANTNSPDGNDDTESKDDDSNGDIVPTKGALNIESTVIDITQSIQLELTGASAKSWTSQDEKIATVDGNGNVTAVQRGKTKIICTDTNDVTYECNITVIYPDITFNSTFLANGTKFKMYYLTFNIVNNTNYNCRLGGSDALTGIKMTAVLLYLYGYNSGSTAAYNATTTPKDVFYDMSETIELPANKTSVVYVIGGKDYGITASTNYLWTLTIEDTKYAVLTDIAGNIIVMANAGPSDVALSLTLPTETPIATPTATQTTSPEASPAATQTASPEPIPTATQTASPETSPAATQTASPKASPAATQPVAPVMTPTAVPTKTPSVTISDDSFEIDSEGTLVKYKGTQEEVVIPDAVTKIGKSAFYECTQLTSVTIPDTVTSIDETAFWGCENLRNIQLPNTLTQIEDGAFAHCTALTRLVIPDSVTSINGPITFYKVPQVINYGCETRNLGANALYNIASDGTLIRYYGSEEDVVIPEYCGITRIGESAFLYSNTYTRSISIPKGVTSIEAYAFSSSSKLESITLPEGVTSIGKNAFMSCDNLKDITLPDSIQRIGTYAFSGCTNLSSLTIPEHVSQIDSYAFSQVPHIYYNGNAEGAPWGASAMN